MGTSSRLSRCMSDVRPAHLLRTSEEEELLQARTLLQDVIDILKSIQDAQDASAVFRQSAALSDKLSDCKRMVATLPGGDASADEQQAVLAREIGRHQQKCAMLENYKNLAVFCHAQEAECPNIDIGQDQNEEKASTSNNKGKRKRSKKA